ncbi:chromatin assembly factor 1 subunit FAS1-like [Actinidia eriantha]|uniref:chromatin assembly factor 1 subunit FAS1-like n=1 Tax=Actinidia eriantha TaxID=165200 RepID=UPI002585E8F3|nr:chromatin assembly factor 1 subunit FAS1-like [Actinidia eriantha]
MAEPMVTDVDESKTKKPETNDSDKNQSAKKSLKRKRASVVDSLTTEEREVRINALREELEGLFKYYIEVSDEKVNLNLGDSGSSNSAIAFLLEESNLTLSKLVGEIYEKTKEKESGITVASVKSSVLFIGQRSLYGVPNADADVLEDESESCLWCWETRDLKLMPKSVRGTLKTRRTCRKKIHERITAVSEMITVLEKLENHQNHRNALTKASERLGKVLMEADIRLLVKSMEQINSANVADKEAKRGEKQLIKQLDRDKREAEKEKRRLDRELKKEKLQSEKELKRLQEEAEKVEKRREKEESEWKKQLKKQQEEAEKNQQRREKEQAEQKKQQSMKKQASIMERFLKRSKNNSTCQNDQSSTEAALSDSPSKGREKMSESVTLSMDRALSLKDHINAEDLHKLHLISWCSLGHAIRSNRKQHWGIRRKPKTEAINKLKLSTKRGLTHDDELTIEKLVDGWGEIKVDGSSCDTNADSSVSSSQMQYRRKQLLQFDKSHRPAFYGIWPKKSKVIGPRHPLRKDPELDYDIDSDEEWEEEEPGESLSDCDKDEEEENLEEGISRADDEEDSEDGFFVPDGYLSENEGVQVDRKKSCLVEETERLLGCEQELESDETCVLLRQQKYLHNLTEHALRKNQPLVISNLMHEKASLLMTEEIAGTPKLEQTCLQALSMRLFPGGPTIEISIDITLQEEDQDTCTINSKDSTTPMATTPAISDSDLPQIVSAIQSCSQGINKVVESLQQKFPSISKSQLRNKVREISDFVDNRWRVKKSILDKLSLSSSPDKYVGRRKSIATFFSKRCLPPTTNGNNIDPTETSPNSSQKFSAAVQSQQAVTNNYQ